MTAHSQERRRTILIVEDDSGVSRMLSTYLDREGYATVSAGTGAEGVDAAAAIMPDLVVLDLVLPDYNGIDVLKCLKTMKKELPVIIFTGFGSQDTVRIAMETGAFDYLTKPFDIREFCKVIRAALAPERSFKSASSV